MEYQWVLTDFINENNQWVSFIRVQSDAWFRSEEEARKNVEQFSKYLDSPDCCKREVYFNKRQSHFPYPPKQQYRWVISDYNQERTLMEIVSDCWFDTKEDAKLNAEQFAEYIGRQKGK